MLCRLSFFFCFVVCGLCILFLCFVFSCVFVFLPLLFLSCGLCCQLCFVFCLLFFVVLRFVHFVLCVVFVVFCSVFLSLSVFAFFVFCYLRFVFFLLFLFCGLCILFCFLDLVPCFSCLFLFLLFCLLVVRPFLVFFVLLCSVVCLFCFVFYGFCVVLCFFLSLSLISLAPPPVASTSEGCCRVMRQNNKHSKEWREILRGTFNRPCPQKTVQNSWGAVYGFHLTQFGARGCTLHGRTIHLGGFQDSATHKNFMRTDESLLCIE